MDCLSPEQMAAYLRGRGDAAAVEGHVRDCPACAMELLLARETLHELRSRAVKPPTARFRGPGRPPWIPWAAAAAVALVAILAFALRPSTPVENPDLVKKTLPVAPRPVAKDVPPKPVDPPKAPDPAPVPIPPPPPKPEPPRPEPPAPKPEPPKPEPPAPKPEPPKPEPEPKKPAPTLVERTLVAKVVRTVGGGAPGKMIYAGDTLTTARQEFAELALEGLGSLYVRENSKVELGAAGEIHLHDGELLARLDAGRTLGALKTPAGDLEVHASMFDVQATKLQTEISLLDGRAAMGAVQAKGPAALVLKTGKAAEARPLDPGFLSWLPDKLAGRRFAGWTEAETFPSLAGFKVTELDAASGRKGLVQVAEQGSAAVKTPLPFKGRYAFWLRVRQYEAKAVVLALQANGQALGEFKVENADGKPWRWIGPFALTSDHLDLGVAALSRFPAGGPERNSFPVVLDALYVSTDLKSAPPERLGEDRRAFDLVLDDPPK